MPEFTLDEYGDWQQWEWGSHRLEELQIESQHWQTTLGLGFPPFAMEVRSDGTYIRAQGVAGFLRVGDIVVEIRPKFLEAADGQSWRRALWRILATVEERPYLGAASTAEATAADSFADLLGWTFLDSFRRGQQEGLPRGYVETSGSLDALRGRIDYGRIIDWIIQPHLIPCVYDVYAEDIPVNRLFRWAASQLASLVRSTSLGRMLYDEALSLSGIGLLPPGLVEAEQLSLPFQYAHLVPALQVSRLLLRRQSLHHKAGVLQAPSFLWKSSDVFEDFVRALLIQICRTKGWLLEKSSQVLAIPEWGSNRYRRGITTTPDFRISINDATTLVLDSKYKVWSARNQPNADDVYQVMAAGRLNDCEVVCLIYPSVGHTRRTPLTWRLVGEDSPKRLVTIFVDLVAMGEVTGERSLIKALMDDVDSAIPMAH